MVDLIMIPLILQLLDTVLRNRKLTGLSISQIADRNCTLSLYSREARLLEFTTLLILEWITCTSVLYFKNRKIKKKKRRKIRRKKRSHQESKRKRKRPQLLLKRRRLKRSKLVKEKAQSCKSYLMRQKLALLRSLRKEQLIKIKKV
jgi:hypothetical protein